MLKFSVYGLFLCLAVFVTFEVEAQIIRSGKIALPYMYIIIYICIFKSHNYKQCSNYYNVHVRILLLIII